MDGEVMKNLPSLDKIEAEQDRRILRRHHEASSRGEPVNQAEYDAAIVRSRKRLRRLRDQIDSDHPHTPEEAQAIVESLCGARRKAAACNRAATAEA